MHKTAFIVMALLVSSRPIRAQEVLSFPSLDAVFAYTNQHSSPLKNATQQTVLAKYQTLGAQWGKWNLQSKANLTLTDNTKLTTNFLPAEIFGGPADKNLALINAPLIIMAEEPTGNLDSKNTDIVFDIFKQLTHEFG